MAMRPKSSSGLLLEFGAVAAIVVVGATFRLWNIGAAPRTLHYDEALNGLVAANILRGELPALVTYPGGREPLIFYLQAASVAVLGRTPGALRLPTALASVGLIVGAQLLARALFGRKIGLLAGLLCATTLWPVYLGRLGTRPVLLPLMLAFALLASVHAWRTRRRAWWAAAGVLFGAVHYTYSPAVFVLPAMLATALGTAAWRGRQFRTQLAGIGVAFSLAALVAAPIVATRAAAPNQTLERPNEVAVFYPGQGPGDVLRTAGTQTYLLLRMFVLKGDLNIRHNLPGRPVFDLAAGVAFVLGAGVAWQRRYRGPAACCATWAAILLLPSFLSKDAPHFLRASGILPVLFVWPALGLSGGQRTLTQRIGRLPGVLVPALLLMATILSTAHDYLFDDFLAKPDVVAAFGGDDVALALAINQSLDTGWTGDNLRARPTPADPARVVWIEPGLWDGDPYAQFLAPAAPDERRYFRFLTPDSALPVGVHVLIVSPDQAAHWASRAPEGVRVVVQDGPSYTPPGDSQPRLRFQIQTWQPS